MVGKGARKTFLKRMPAPMRLGERGEATRLSTQGERVVVQQVRFNETPETTLSTKLNGPDKTEGWHGRTRTAYSQVAEGSAVERPVTTLPSIDRWQGRQAQRDGDKTVVTVSRQIRSEDWESEKQQGRKVSEGESEAQKKRHVKRREVMEGERADEVEKWQVEDVECKRRRERRVEATREARWRRRNRQTEPEAEDINARKRRREWRKARQRAEAMLAAAEESLRLDMARW